ncbi:glycosyltransferase family 9 protein [Dryocola clanedunensis]
MSFSAFRMKILGYVLSLFKRINYNKNDAFINEIAFKRILIISNKLLGDFLFCTPAIRSLRDRYPDAKIVAVINPKNKGLIGKSHFIDDVVYMDNKTSDIFKAYWKIKNFQPEIAIIFHSRTPYDIMLAVFSGCRYIVKHYFNNDVKKLFSLCDDYVLDVDKPPVINNLSLVEKLGCEITGSKMFFPAEIKAPQKNEHVLRVGYQLGASKPNRYLPVNSITELTKKIKDIFPLCEFYLFGAPTETSLGEAFLSGLEPSIHKDVVNHIGKTTLIELANAVNNVDVLVTPDTGTLHISTALGVKTVSLFVCRRKNGCEPQQDPDLHTVIYASDFNELAFDRTQSRPLEYISVEVLFESVKNAINQKSES